MLVSVEIFNFQSHKHTIINLSKGVNIFNGLSDKGKTAIKRAIGWVIDNKPSGDAFRSHWGGNTVVELSFSDGNVIRRTKSNTENSYTINNEVPLKAFGQGMPDEVKKILNLESVNIQSQMDAPFLLSETAGEVASHFNRIAGISIIDKSISKAKSAVSKTKLGIEQRENDLQEKMEQLKNYETLPDLQKRISTLERKDTTKKNEYAELIALKNKVSRLVEIENDLDEVEDFLQIEKPVALLVVKKKEIVEKKVEIQKMKRQIDKIDLIYGTLEATEKLIGLEPKVNDLLRKQKDIKQFQAEIKPLNGLVVRYTNLTKILEGNERKLTELLSLIPNVCPICKGTGKLK